MGEGEDAIEGSDGGVPAVGEGGAVGLVKEPASGSGVGFPQELGENGGGGLQDGRGEERRDCPHVRHAGGGRGGKVEVHAGAELGCGCDVAHEEGRDDVHEIGGGDPGCRDDAVRYELNATVEPCADRFGVDGGVGELRVDVVSEGDPRGGSLV